MKPAQCIFYRNDVKTQKNTFILRASASLRLVFLLLFCHSSFAQGPVITGADRMNVWFPYLENKTVAVFANQTSMIGHTHLVDSLLSRGVNIKKIFGPEHGFRGTANAGEELKDGIDSKTKLPVVSLYGDHKKPTRDDRR